MEEDEKQKQEEYLNTMLDFCSHKGYQNLVEDAQTKIDSLKEILTNPAITDAEIRFVQGRISAIKDFVGLKNLFERVSEDRKAEVENE